MFDTGMIAIGALLIGTPIKVSVAGRRPMSAKTVSATPARNGLSARWWLSLIPTVLVLAALIAIAAYVPFHGAKIDLPIRDVIGASVPMPDFFGSILTTR